MLKQTQQQQIIVDNKDQLLTDLTLNKGTEINTSAEQGADFMDFYSNGFKIQTSDVKINNNNTAHYFGLWSNFSRK